MLDLHFVFTPVPEGGIVTALPGGVPITEKRKALIHLQRCIERKVQLLVLEIVNALFKNELTGGAIGLHPAHARVPAELVHVNASAENLNVLGRDVAPLVKHRGHHTARQRVMSNLAQH